MVDPLSSQVVLNMSPNLLALRRSGMRLLMCCSSLAVADFASPEGYFGPPVSTPYYPTGDIQGDRNAAFTSAVTVVDAGTWGPRVRSDRGKSWEPAHRCTITCDYRSLVIFHRLLGRSIASSCSTWFYCSTPSPS